MTAGGARPREEFGHLGRAFIPPPPGLSVPGRWTSEERVPGQSLRSTPPLPETAFARGAESTPGPDWYHANSGNDPFGLTDARPVCPQPRRPVQTLFEAPSLPASPSPVLGGYPVESPDHWGTSPEKKDYKFLAEGGRPLSSVSTCAGPSPPPVPEMPWLSQVEPIAPRTGSPMDEPWCRSLIHTEHEYEASLAAARATAAAAAVSAVTSAAAHRPSAAGEWGTSWHSVPAAATTAAAAAAAAAAVLGLVPNHNMMMSAMSSSAEQEQARQSEDPRGQGARYPPQYFAESEMARYHHQQALPHEKLSKPTLKGNRGMTSQVSKGPSGNDSKALSGFDGQPLTKDFVVALAKTQEGSKWLQKKLLKGHPSVIKDILEGLETSLPEIMCNMYGNYLCSSAFQACSVSQRLRMLEISCRSLCYVAKDRWGTHAVQSLLSLLCTKEEMSILTPAIKEHIVELCCHQHGSHVMVRALVSLGVPCPDVVISRIAGNMRAIAHNPHGLAVLKRVISLAQPGEQRRLLLRELSHHAVDLVQGPFGNYAVQHAIEEWGGAECEPMIKALQGRLLQLSIQKFSSNVVELLLRHAPQEAQQNIVLELGSPERAEVLMSTVYGQYVARQLLQVIGPDRRPALEAVLYSAAKALRNPRLRERWDLIAAGAQDGAVEEAAFEDFQSPPDAMRSRGALPEADSRGRRRRGRANRGGHRPQAQTGLHQDGSGSASLGILRGLLSTP